MCLPERRRVAVCRRRRLLASSGRHGISLHRLPGLEPSGRLLRPERGAFTAVALSRDAALLAAVSAGGGLAVYDTATGRQVRRTCRGGRPWG
jgi:hypothetical protein